MAAANQREIARYSAFIKYCRDLVMGEYLQGIRCSNDSDCYSGKCDKTFGQCVQDDFDVLRVHKNPLSCRQSLDCSSLT